MPVYEVYDERLGKDCAGLCPMIITDSPRNAAISFDRDHSNSPDNVITVVVVEWASDGFVESKWRVTRELSTSITYEAEPVPEPLPSHDSPPVGTESKPTREPKFQLGQRVALASNPDVDMCVEWNDWHENLAEYYYVCVWLDIDQKPAREHYSERALISKEPKPVYGPPVPAGQPLTKFDLLQKVKRSGPGLDLVERDLGNRIDYRCLRKAVRFSSLGEMLQNASGGKTYLVIARDGTCLDYVMDLFLKLIRRLSAAIKGNPTPKLHRDLKAVEFWSTIDDGKVWVNFCEEPPGNLNFFQGRSFDGYVYYPSDEPVPMSHDADKDSGDNHVDAATAEEQGLREEVSKDLGRVYEASLAKRFTIFAESYFRELERRLGKCNNIPGVVCGEIMDEVLKHLQGIENKLFEILEMPERVVNGTLDEDNGDSDPDDPGFEDSEVDPC